MVELAVAVAVVTVVEHAVVVEANDCAVLVVVPVGTVVVVTGLALVTVMAVDDTVENSNEKGHAAAALLVKFLETDAVGFGAEDVEQCVVVGLAKIVGYIVSASLFCFAMKSDELVAAVATQEA